MLTTPITTAIKGANQYIVAKGLLSPIAFLCITSSVKAHLRPDNADAANTMINPGIDTSVVLKTMRKTPNEMSKMTEIRRNDGVSMWKRKAKRRTKSSAEDFTMAETRQYMAIILTLTI
jgi:hypothetical protein